MLEQLIQEGEALKGEIQEGMGYYFLSGENYEKWIAKSILFLERKYPDNTLTNRFLEASEEAAKGNDVKYYYRMIGILKALSEMEVEEIDAPDTINNVTGW